jgi:phage shock protein C
MYCNACGKAIADDARYCAYCGCVVGHPPTAKRLTRPRANRTIAGVCAGMGPYLDLDVSLVRLTWVLVVIFSGIFPGILVYVLAWIIIPEEPAWVPVSSGQPITNP